MIERLVVVGAGGHGRETMDIIRAAIAAGRIATAEGFVDDGLRAGTLINDRPVLGDLQWLVSMRSEVAAVIAFGNPLTTRRIAEMLSAAGVRVASAISPSAQISNGAHIGDGVIMFPNTVVNVGATIEAHVTLNVGATVSHDSRVGRYANLNPGARIAGNAVIGVGAYVGMGANVIQSVKIGDWVTVGAGATVIADLPEGVTAVGVPARIIKTTKNSYELL